MEFIILSIITTYFLLGSVVATKFIVQGFLDDPEEAASVTFLFAAFAVVFTWPVTYERVL